MLIRSRMGEKHKMNLGPVVRGMLRGMLPTALLLTASVAAVSQEQPAAPQVGGGGGPFGGGRGPRVPPGEYSVKVSVGGKDVTTTVRVQEDPRFPIDRMSAQASSECRQLDPIQTSLRH